jgi:hypothetical protein
MADFGYWIYLEWSQNVGARAPVMDTVSAHCFPDGIPFLA